MRGFARTLTKLSDPPRPTPVPQLRWNEVDLLDFFSAEPRIDDGGVSHDYEIERDGLRLHLTIWQYESLIMISLYRSGSETSLITLSAFVRGEVRFIDDKRGRLLEFEDGIVVWGRFWHVEGRDWDRLKNPVPMSVRLAIDPDIRVTCVDCQDRT